MNEEKIIVILYMHRKNKRLDVEIPLNISANELILALNQGFGLGMDTSEISKCYLKTENPIALLKGNKKVSEYELHNGTIINYTL